VVDETWSGSTPKLEHEEISVVDETWSGSTPSNYSMRRYLWWMKPGVAVLPVTRA